MRSIVNFNAKWAFTKQCSAVPAELPMDWDQVNLPHCWNAVDGQDGGNDYHRGTCLYAKSFSRASLPESALYYLEIRGANSSAEVFVFSSVRQFCQVSLYVAAFASINR